LLIKSLLPSLVPKKKSAKKIAFFSWIAATLAWEKSTAVRLDFSSQNASERQVGIRKLQKLFFRPKTSEHVLRICNNVQINALTNSNFGWYSIR
jgi:hypothetical protein